MHYCSAIITSCKRTFWLGQLADAIISMVIEVYAWGSVAFTDLNFQSSYASEENVFSEKAEDSAPPMKELTIWRLGLRDAKNEA